MTDADMETEDTIAERAAEDFLKGLTITTIAEQKRENEDLVIRLNEAFALIDDKEKELDRERLLIGELELRIEDLKKKPAEQLAQLQAEYDLKCEEVKELRSIEGKRTSEQDFILASKVVSPPKVWVAAVNALNLYRGLNDASRFAIEHNNPWKKVMFDVADDGQLKNARLEESS